MAFPKCCRCYYHWNVVADLRRNKSFDLFFSAYILICFGIVMEGIIRYCPHYFGYGFVTVSVAVWVRRFLSLFCWCRSVSNSILMGFEHGSCVFGAVGNSHPRGACVCVHPICDRLLPHKSVSVVEYCHLWTPVGREIRRDSPKGNYY